MVNIIGLPKQLDMRTAKKFEIRTLFDMREVIYDKEWLSSMKNNIDLYYMYRGLSLNKKDAPIMKKNGLRYDITIIPPFMLGKEFVKTTGHYHPVVPGTNVTFPEMCEIIKGEANYILQKLEKESITDIVLIKAKTGDKVIVPPGYGHITYNSSNEELKIANWIADGFKSIYKMKEKGGGAYFILKNDIIKNPMYESAPEIRECKPANYIFEELKDIKDIYGLIKEIDKLKFLTNPKEYREFFEKLLNWKI